jgi:nucleotidyltransferase/DNA polymerase involved in DNA repair
MSRYGKIARRAATVTDCRLSSVMETKQLALFGPVDWEAEDRRLVVARRVSKSIGSEHTLDENIYKKADIKHHLRRSADIVGRRLRKKNYAACGARIKLKTFDFEIVTRRRQLSEPTDVTESLYNLLTWTRPVELTPHDRGLARCSSLPYFLRFCPY